MKKHNKQIIAVLTMIAIELGSLTGYAMPVRGEEIMSLLDEPVLVEDADPAESFHI